MLQSIAMDPIWRCRLTRGVFTPLAMTANAQCERTVPEDTVPTHVYMSSTKEHTHAHPPPPRI